MRITWFGHSAFLVEASDGTRLVIDPYRSGSFDGGIAYKPISVQADAVAATHRHEDHGAVDTLPGHPRVLMEPDAARVGAIAVEGMHVYHDADQGEARGENTILIMDVDGMRVVHLGDLGHELSPEQLERLGDVDVLMIPVGGFFTIDAATAAQVVAELAPRVVIPMHYKTSRCGFDIAPVDDFLELQADVREVSDTSIELDRDSLPDVPTVYVLEYVD